MHDQLSLMFVSISFPFYLILLFFLKSIVLFLSLKLTHGDAPALATQVLACTAMLGISLTLHDAS